MTRHYALQGVENFRDFGDYAAGQGRLKKGVLFRAAHQAEATDEDLAALAALGITTLVDLRRPNERESSPSRRWSGFSAQVIVNDLGMDGGDPWHAFLKSSDLSVGAVHDYMDEYYRRLPFKERHIDLFSRYFQAVADGQGAVLIHCAAGKDRTGVLAALTHHIAGVSDDDVIDDYLLTNDPARFDRRGAGFMDKIEEVTGRRPSEAAMRAILGVEARYLAAAFEVIKAEYGSLDGYLEQAVGLDAQVRETVREKILAESKYPSPLAGEGGPRSGSGEGLKTETAATGGQAGRHADRTIDPSPDRLRRPPSPARGEGIVLAQTAR